jgi:hypothetical protein
LVYFESLIGFERRRCVKSLGEEKWISFSFSFPALFRLQFLHEQVRHKNKKLPRKKLLVLHFSPSMTEVASAHISRDYEKEKRGWPAPRRAYEKNAPGWMLGVFAAVGAATGLSIGSFVRKRWYSFPKETYIIIGVASSAAGLGLGMGAHKLYYNYNPNELVEELKKKDEPTETHERSK